MTIALSLAFKPLEFQLTWDAVKLLFHFYPAKFQLLELSESDKHHCSCMMERHILQAKVMKISAYSWVESMTPVSQRLVSNKDRYYIGASQQISAIQMSQQGVHHSYAFFQMHAYGLVILKRNTIKSKFSL